jgi:uncharacterized protein (DUF433 family)
MKQSSVVHCDPEILGGTPVFVGTRVPVQALIDYIEGGHSLEEFLDDFPSVSRVIAIAALEQAKAHLLADARASVIVIEAPSNDIEDLRPMMSAVREALPNAKPGTVTRVRR